MPLLWGPPLPWGSGFVLSHFPQAKAAMGVQLRRLGRNEEAQPVEVGLKDFTISVQLLNCCWEDLCVLS